MGIGNKKPLHHASSWEHFASWEFASALGEMRGTFGVILAQIAASYGTDISNDLASIVPGERLNDD